MGEDTLLDTAFLAGIKEELASIEENEKNIQALSQVFRYYAKHAKQLAQVLVDFTTKTCFPWELIHALHLIDDILLMDNSGRYKKELIDQIQVISVNSFKKVQSDEEKKEVARMLHAWRVLKIFDAQILDDISLIIKALGDRAAEILEEASNVDADDDDEEFPDLPETAEGSVPPASSPPPAGESTKKSSATEEPKIKKPKVATTSNGTTPIVSIAKTLVEARPAPPKAMADRAAAIINRIVRTPVEKPFELLGIAQEGVDGHDIRKAYRKIALLIHPDKNPGSEVKCGEALTKLQQAREQAERDLQRIDAVAEAAKRGADTRSAAKAAANETLDSSLKCRYPGCDLPPCKQCANGCCTRNITHCHMIARSKPGLQCFFHPPPRAWARNAE